MNDACATERFDGCSVLIYERNALLAQELETFCRDVGCNVVGPVGDCDDVVAICRREKVDAALIHLGESPDLNADVLRTLREIGVAIAVISAHHHENLPEGLRDVPHLEKPYCAKDVFRLVKGLLRPLECTDTDDLAPTG